MSAPETGLPWRRLAWTLWWSSLVALLLAAWSYRREGAQPLAVECTVLAQSTSLAHDFDLRYERQDHDRHLFTWRGQPAVLELGRAVGEDGISWSFDGSLVPSLVYAPFLRIWPRRGFALANALVLVLAAAFCGWKVARLRGPPWLLALLAALLLSPLLVHVFLAQGMIPVVAAVLLAMTLLAASPGSGGNGRGRYVLSGLLLWPAVALAWPNLVLVPLAMGLVPGGRRRGLLPWLLLGLVVGWGAEAGLRHALGAAGGEPTRWNVASGFPGIDFSLDSVSDSASNIAMGALTSAWPAQGGALLVFWRLVDRLLSREAGLLLYLPWLIPWLLLAVGRARKGHPAALGAFGLSLLWGLASIAYRPFGGATEELLTGGDALPLYAALVGCWLFGGGVVPGKGEDPRASKVRDGLPAALACLAAVLFLPPMLRAPWSLPFAPTGSHVATAAAGLAPRTTIIQPARRVAPGTTDDLELLLLDANAWYQGRSARLMLAGPSELLVVRRQPLDALVLEPDDATAVLRIHGDLAPSAPGTTEVGGALRLVAEGGRRHPLWWTSEPRWVYRLTLAPGRMGLSAWKLTMADRPPGESDE